MKIMVGGNICDEKDAVVSVYDHGFLYGIGLFETFRTYRGQCFLLEEHLDRLSQSCKEIGIEWKPDPQHIELQVQELLSINQLEDGYVRYSISAGKAELGLPTDLYGDSNTIIYIKKLVPRDEHLIEQGKALQRLKIKRNTPEGTMRFKSFHYMNNILAKRELQGYAWAQQAEGLFLNQEGYLAEGIVSNLFFIRNQKGYTPDISTGILAGITRAHVMDLFSTNGFSIEEGFYVWEDLLQADEIFMTNSIQELVPIHQLYDEQGRMWMVGNGQVGKLTQQLIHAYQLSTGSLNRTGEEHHET